MEQETRGVCHVSGAIKLFMPIIKSPKIEAAGQHLELPFPL